MLLNPQEDILAIKGRNGDGYGDDCSLNETAEDLNLKM
jgi:hypothetical protein